MDAGWHAFSSGHEGEDVHMEIIRSLVKREDYDGDF